MTFLIALLLCLDGGPLEALRAEPELQSFTWISAQKPTYAPFLFLLGTKDGAPSAAEVEATFAQALETMVSTWRDEFATPLKITPKESSPVLPIAVLPDADAYRRYVKRKQPALAAVIPPTFRSNGVTLTYLRGDGESMMARRKAVLQAAARQLLDLYRAAEGESSGWLTLALVADLSEIEQQPAGRLGYVWVRRPIPYWRDDLPKLALSLQERNVPLPSFEELLTPATPEEVNEQAAALGKSLGNTATEVAATYRRYVELCAYSLEAYLFSAPQHTKAFQQFIADEFGGHGGYDAFKAKLPLAQIEPEWDAFCMGNAPPVAKASAGTNPSARSAADREAAALPAPASLDLTPQSVLDLRAELIRRTRARKFSTAASLFDLAAIKSAVDAAMLADERKQLDAALSLYRLAARQFKAGDKLSAKLGPAGDITSVSRDGFELKQKDKTASYAWTDLDLAAVANHCFQNLKYNDARGAFEVATAWMLAGEFVKAKNYLQQAAKKGHPAAEVARLEKLLVEMPAALVEARARESLEGLLKLDGDAWRQAVQAIVAQPELRASAVFGRADAYLRGRAAEVLARDVEKRGVAALFRGQTTTNANGLVTIRYAFQERAEQDDWAMVLYPSVDGWLKNARSTPAEWRCSGGTLWIKPAGCLMHAAAFNGDVALEFTVRTGPMDDADQDQIWELMPGIGDDGQGHFAAAWNWSQAIVKTASGRRDSKGELAVQAEVDYRVKLARSGNDILVFRDGKQTGRLTEADLRGQRVFLFAVGATAFFIRDLTITGTPDSTWSAARRTEVIRAAIDALLAPTKPEIDAAPEAKDKPPATTHALPVGNRGQPAVATTAVLHGLTWLARHQSADGHWDPRTFTSGCHDPSCAGPGHLRFGDGLTGLALLAFLGANFPPDSAFAIDDPYSGQPIVFGQVVARGLKYLLAKQTELGAIGTDQYMYNQAICATVLAEAYQRTKDAKLREPAQRAVHFIELAQNKDAQGLSGWRYAPFEGKSDTSVTGWCAMALKAGERAGLETGAEHRAGALRWIKEATNESSRVGYLSAGDAGDKVENPEERGTFDHHESMTAVGMLVRTVVERNWRDPVLAESAAHLVGDVPAWEPVEKRDYYYWYYGSLALWQYAGPQSPNPDKSVWTRWWGGIERALIAHQANVPASNARDDYDALYAKAREQGCSTGSFEPSDRFGYAGRVYATALNVLTLEVFYRYENAFNR